MADVTDRAQLLTVVGIVLAVTLVGTAMVANTVIFTENLATRETTRTMEDSGDYRAAANQSLSTALNRLNRNPNNLTHSTLKTNYRDTVDAQELILQRDTSGSGGALALSVVSATSGYRLRQTDSSRAYTAGGSNAGAAGWTLATDVDETRKFTMNVSRSELYEATVDTLMSTLLGNAYHVEVSNGTDTWKVFFFQDFLTNSVHVFTVKNSNSPTGVVLDNLGTMCSYSAPVVRVDLLTGTLNGTDCAQLDFYRSIDERHSIAFRNAETLGFDRAGGTYDIHVSDAQVPTSNFNAPPTSPYARTAVPSSVVRMTYQTADLDYDARLTVQQPTVLVTRRPGSPPQVTNVDVVDDRDGIETYDFTVTADVADPDGNLDRVRFTLTDDEGSLVAEATDTSISGSSATSTHQFQGTTLTGIVDDDDNFTIEVTVIDQQGRVDSTAEVHEADNDDSGSPPVLVRPDEVFAGDQAVDEPLVRSALDEATETTADGDDAAVT